MVTTTSKLQLSPALSCPPVKLKLSVPEICEAPPQTAADGSPTASAPGNMAFRSSVKALSVMASAAPSESCRRVKRRVVLPPGATGSSMNCLVSVSAPPTTVNRSEIGCATRLAPPRM